MEAHLTNKSLNPLQKKKKKLTWLCWLDNWTNQWTNHISHHLKCWFVWFWNAWVKV